MSEKFVSFRCPPELLNALDARANTLGVTRSAFIINLLQEKLGLSQNNTNVIRDGAATLDALLSEINAKFSEKIENLEKRLAALSTQVSESNAEVIQASKPNAASLLENDAKFSEKLDNLEKRMVALESQVAQTRTEVVPASQPPPETLRERDAKFSERIDNLEKHIGEKSNPGAQSKTEVIPASQSNPASELTQDLDGLKEGLTEKQLVERLQKKARWIKANTLRQWTAQELLPDITRQHDPDNLGWQLVNNLYAPIADVSRIDNL